MSRLLPALLVFLSVPAARAATGGAPLTIAHSGYVLDAVDAPVSGSHTFVFRIYDASSGGTLQWEGTCAGVAVQGGYYAVTLGGAGCSGTGGAGDHALDTADVPASGAYLEVRVDATQLLPRLALVTAPTAAVATRALDADLLDGKPSTFFATAAHVHAGEEITSGKIGNSYLNTGSGHGLDADTVDGQHATAFAAASHTHTAAQVTDLATTLSGYLPKTGGTLTGGLVLGGALQLVTDGSSTGCGAGTAGALRWNAGNVEVCNGTTWGAIGSSSGSCSTVGHCQALPATSCQQIRAAVTGFLADGLFWLDPNGGSNTDAFQAWCDMNTDSGGWTLLARVSDTNGAGGDYEFRTISGGGHSILNAAWSGGTPTGAQYALGFDKTFPSGTGTLDLQYLCYSSQNRAATTYWVKAKSLSVGTLLTNLNASGNPDFFLTNVAVENKDGNTSTTGNYALMARGNQTTGVNCGNSWAGQTGIKYSCVSSGQSVMSPPSVWFTMDYVGQTYGEVTSCGSAAGNTMPWYVGEVRYREVRPGSRAEVPATSCQAIYDLGVRTNGAYWIDPNGGAATDSFQAWCDLTTEGGGWTKVMYFSGTRTVPTTTSLNPTTLGTALTNPGKLSDANINLLMTGNKQMLAVYPADTSKWLTVTWGSNWTFNENRQSGTAGGFCQDMTSGGALKRHDGTTDSATYRDGANVRSSYCWKTPFSGGGDGGIDLQDDGTGASNASTAGVAQTAFVMFVR